MTRTLFLTCTLASAIGCVGPMPYSTTYYGPRPQRRVVAEDAAAPAPTEEDGEAAPTPAPKTRARRGERLACVRDRAGKDFASASKLGKGVGRGCIDGSNFDVYTLTAGPNKGGTLFGIKMDASEAVCVELFDQDRKAATGSECIVNGAAQHVWAAVAPNTTIYVRLERLRTHEVGPYQLDVTETAIADDEEPNNSWKTATPLALGQPHQALLGDVLNATDTQKDIYKIKVTKTSKLEIVVDPSSDDVQPKVTIFDADRREVGGGYADNRGAILREDAELAAGTYYVQVEEYGWGVGYGNGPAGTEKPTGHYSKPYKLEVRVKGDSTKKRVSKR